MASPTVAANAYANLAKIIEQPGAGKGSEAGGLSFSMVKRMSSRVRRRRPSRIACRAAIR